MDRIEKLRAFGNEQNALKQKKTESQKEEQKRLMEEIEKYKNQIRGWQPRIEKLIETVNVALVEKIIAEDELKKIEDVFDFIFTIKNNEKYVYALGSRFSRSNRLKYHIGDKINFITDGFFLHFMFSNEKIRSRKIVLKNFVDTFEDVEKKIYDTIDNILKR